MRRIAAGTAITLLAAVAIGGPLASAGHAAPTSLQCGTAAPPAACGLLDDLAARLGPLSPLLGAPLAPLTSSAQAFAAQSDQPAGVPTAEVVQVSQALLAQLAALPEPVETLVGGAGLGGLTDTLHAIVAELTAPATGGQQSAGTSEATPAATSSGAAGAGSVSGARSSGTSSYGSSASASSPSSSPSSAGVPDVPVGDPLTLAPLALPDFGFDTSFEPASTALPSAEAVEEAAFAEAIDEMAGQGHTPELAVVAVLSLLLLGAAGVAQLQANRHSIPD